MDTNIQTQDKPQLHQSDLGMLGTCQIKWRRMRGFRFGVAEKEEIPPPTVNMAIGTAVHKTAQRYLGAKLRGEQLPDAKEIRSLALAETTRLWQEGLFLNPEEALDIEGTQKEMTATAEQLATLYLYEIGPKMMPAAVEEPWVVKLDNYPFDLSGQFDLRETNYVLHDLKTKGMTPQAYAADSVQTWMYSYAASIVVPELEGKLPPRFDLDCLIATGKSFKAVTISAVPTQLWVDRLFARLDNFAQLIAAAKAGHDVFTPADPEHPWACRRKMCPFWNSCSFWCGR